MSEIKIPSCPHTYVSPTPHLLRVMEKIATAMHGAVNITSGVRCIHCNGLAGGVALSAHISGEAVDIGYSGSYNLFELLRAITALGVMRIGIYKSHVHIDVATSKPQGVIWMDQYNC